MLYILYTSTQRLKTMKKEEENKNEHTTIRVSKSFRDSLAAVAPKNMTFEEFIEDNLDLNEVDLK